ncbi:hypothetical protein GCM10010201_34830 [Pilimelia columellifera subsp. columellifera]|uniref:Uncharacterized protein n=1 Tax=Pilimelia columellifera subsp. columellifera TaxID=706583 RepID=A0ABN3NRF5_9ACTN
MPVPAGTQPVRLEHRLRQNDLTTSIWNRTGRKVCFYNDTNHQRQLLSLDAGGSTANVGSAANDRISSFQPF